jgi:hypothetical protein
MAPGGTPDTTGTTGAASANGTTGSTGTSVDGNPAAKDAIESTTGTTGSVNDATGRNKPRGAYNTGYTEGGNRPAGAPGDTQPSAAGQVPGTSGSMPETTPDTSTDNSRKSLRGSTSWDRSDRQVRQQTPQ